MPKTTLAKESLELKLLRPFGDASPATPSNTKDEGEVADMSLDPSGRYARLGYRFQDLCALRHGIAALSSNEWHEVICENAEDVVLRRKTGSEVFHRFMQVKFKVKGHKHWSVADLLQYEKIKNQTRSDSILGKLFANFDTWGPNCDFRLVTNEGTNEELDPFVTHFGEIEPPIDFNCKQFKSVLQKATKEPLNNCSMIDACVRSFRVEIHAGSVDAISAMIQREISELLKSEDTRLMTDEVEAVFLRLYLIFHLQASSSPKSVSAQRAITMSELMLKLREESLLRKQETKSGSEEPTKQLRNVLSSIGFDQAAIKEAEQHRFFISTEYRRNPTGTNKRNDLDYLREEIRAIAAARRLHFGFESLTRERANEYLQQVVDEARNYYAMPTHRFHGVEFRAILGTVYYLVAKGTIRLVEV